MKIVDHKKLEADILYKSINTKCYKLYKKNKKTQKYY